MSGEAEPTIAVAVAAPSPPSEEKRRRKHCSGADTSVPFASAVLSSSQGSGLALRGSEPISGDGVTLCEGEGGRRKQSNSGRPARAEERSRTKRRHHGSSSGERDAELAALRAQLDRMQTQLDKSAAAASERPQQQQPSLAREESSRRSSLHLDTADASDVANIYSYSTEMALASVEPRSIALATAWVTLCTFVQVIFAFGFYSASILVSSTSSLPAFMDPVDTSLFYVHSLVPGTLVPQINLLASLCSIVLLALLMKNDNEATLLTTCPFERLVLRSPAAGSGDGDGDDDDGRGDVRAWAGYRATTRDESLHALVKQPPTIRNFLRVVLCFWLQLGWCCRAMLVPVCAALGTAGAFAGSKDAQEIVLNSVAIGFVFDLDEVLYASVLPQSRKDDFERAPPPRTSPLSPSNERARQLVGNYCWLCLLLDVSMPGWYYAKLAFQTAGDTVGTELHLDAMRYYCVARLCTLAAGQVHIAFHSGRPRDGCRLGVGACLYAVGLVGMGLVVYTLVFAAWLFPNFSFNIEPLNNDERMAGCVRDAENADCVLMHFETDIHSQLLDAYGSLSVSSAIEQAWGS